MLIKYYNEVGNLSNFDFLKGFDDTLYKLGNRIEKEVKIAPSAVKADATPFLEYLVNKLLNKVGLKFNYRKDFYSQLDTVYRKGLIDYNYKNKIYDAYMLRNKIHDSFEEMVKNEVIVALGIHEKLYNIAKKYYLDFNENGDEYNGVPSYKPIELDTSDEEIDLVKIPDFSEIIDFRYDYCVICGEPNHSSYSLCCPKCGRVLDDANNFISIRNHFGKDATLTKEKLIEYGIHEGYVNQLLTHLVRENMLNAKGRFYTFNNMNFDRYMTKIDNYLAVGELITKFREDKITPKEIKQTFEYREGSLHHEPFYEFYKIIDHEIINKFEQDILLSEDIWKSMDYTTITQRQLETWYLKNLNQYNKGNVNESFVAFNNLLMGDYIDLKRQGMAERNIKNMLNVSQRVYDFWIGINDSFESEIAQIRKDLILKALGEGKTEAEAMEFAGVTPQEYENLYKISNYYHDDYALEINEEREARKLRFISYLDSVALASACRFAKISVGDFYSWYDSSKLNSQFYLETTRILMGKYLDERRKGKSKRQSIELVGLDERYLDQWLKRGLDICKQFKDDDLRVTVDLILRGFKWNKSKGEICELADVTESVLDRFLKVGEKGSEIHRPLFDYYENEFVPKRLDKFLEIIAYRTIRKALEAVDLTENELEKYYCLGKSGDERFEKFHDDFYNIKKSIYVYHFAKGKTHQISMKESLLTQKEFEENHEEIDARIRELKFRMVLDAVVDDDKTSNVAAERANVSVDEIYEWYFMGRDGVEEYEQFYTLFHGAYVRPAVNAIQDSMDNNLSHLDNLIKVNKKHFTKRDVEIWIKHGLVDNTILVNLDNDETDKKKDNDDKFDANEMLREMGVEDYDRISTRKSSNQSTILNKSDYDVEDLKKQILKK